MAALHVHSGSLVWLVAALVLKVKDKGAVYTGYNELISVVMEVSVGNQPDFGHVRDVYNIVQFIDEHKFEVF
jgi:hypothetical protein